MVLKSQLQIKVSDENLLKVDDFNELIMYKAFIKPILKKKIVTILIEGETGSGKSMLSLALAERLEHLFDKIKDTTTKFNPEKQVVYIPTEYGDKVDEWSKSKYITLVVDELRFLVPKNKWQSLINQSIAEVNAVVRAVKYKHSGYGGIIIYNTQDISDISKDMRKTINFDFVVKRYENYVKAIPYQFWLNKFNVEKPVLRYKKVSVKVGGLDFKIDFLIPRLPSPEVRRKFEQISVEAKLRILKRKRNIIINEMRSELGASSTLKSEIAQDEMWSILKDMARYKRGKITFDPEKQKMIMRLFNINKTQYKKEFLPAFFDEAKRRGLM